MKMDLSKLKKLKMPAKQDPALEAKEEEMGMDLDDDQEEGEPEEHKAMVLGDEAEEAPEAMEEAAPAELEHVSDDDLLAEIQKRGLLDQLESGKMSAKEEDALPYIED